MNPVAAQWLAVASPPLAFVVALASLTWLLGPERRWMPVDHPNGRSLHSTPTPRSGGVAVIDASLLAVPVAVLALGWAINLYNFMDGADRLSGGMTAIGFSALAAGFLRVGDTGAAALSAAIALAALAFLRYNFHPARIFMGDVGVVPLGFLAGALGAIGIAADYWPVWFPALAFAPFWIDASITLGRRLLRGERVWTAHRQHYFQRLVRSGWTHRRVALAEYAAMAFSAAVAMAALECEGVVRVALLAGWAVAAVAAMVWIDRRLPARRGE